MEEKVPLHAQKVAILSRLMKENTSLTLEESLILLKDETVEDNQVVDNQLHRSILDLQPYTGYPGVLKYNPFRYGYGTTSSGTTSTNTTFITSSGDSLEPNTDIEHANL